MTSTAVAVQEQSAEPALAIVRTDPLADAIRQFQSTLGLAGALVRSGFLPKAINTPEKAVAVILAGRELGIGPMLALRSISIIDGKPVVAADLQLARFKADGGRAVFAELTAEKAVLQLRHPNGDEHMETFTIVDARAAGLLGKDNWKKFPKAMLRSRVITAGLKSLGYEPTCGVYDPDEADHFRPAAPPASVTSTTESVVEAEVTEDAATDPVRNTEWALAYPFPFQKGTTVYGRPLSQLSTEHLQKVKQWIVDKRAEKGDDGWNDEAYDAIDLTLRFRLHDPRQSALALDEPPAVAPVVASPSAAEPSMADLAKSIDRLLRHEKLNEDERKDFRQRAAAAQSTGALSLLIGELEDVITRPF